MKKDQIVLLKDRGLITVYGEDSKSFLQNIITNDVYKVNSSNTIFSALFTPQGKYLFEFFLLQSKKGYIIECDNKFTIEIIHHLLKYKLKSKIEIKDASQEYVVGVVSLEKFMEIQENKNKSINTVEYRGCPLFLDPRNKRLGARILSTLEKLHLTIKKLNLKIIKPETYFINAYSLGIPIKGIENLKEQLFGLEANFNELQAIDFKKGCYIGQENTARMSLKNKIRRRWLPIKSNVKLNLGDELTFNNVKIGKILINEPYPFALISLFNPDFSNFKDQEIYASNGKVRIINNDSYII